MRITLFLLLSFLSLSISAQNVSINSTGNPPDESAMLDIQSTNRGILIPRMSSTQRSNIASPSNGLLVFDNTTQSFWYFDVDEWVQLVGKPNSISDEDMDTDISVETNPDEDIIRMRIDNDEGFVLRQSPSGVHRFSTYELSRNLFFGYNAGLNSTSGFNTFLGYETGLSNTGGAQNVFIGYQAGELNQQGDGNIMIGYRAGNANQGSFNTFIGRNAGLINGDADGNVFIGYNSGDSNTSGGNNVFVGYNSAQSNTDGEHNSFIGQGSGFYNTSGSDNTFVGEGSGRRNRTGDRNTAIGSNALGTNLTSGDLGDANTAVGNDAGFSLNEASFNTYMGESAGRNNTDGDGNTLVGYRAGFFMQNGQYNTALGYTAYQNNNGGSHNIAIGDSAMYLTTGSNNIAIGFQAGELSNGSSNIFMGRRAGASNNGGSQNTFIGDRSGESNTSGLLNTFYGASSGLLNTTGNENSFLGFRSGNRNTIGQGNTFVGNDAGRGNTSGNENVSLGLGSLEGNSFGSGNVAIGHEALANISEIDNDLNRTENTALGFHSGRFDLGNYNITLGSNTSAGDNNYNIALGHEASANALTSPNGSYGIAVGYQAEVGGQESIAIGRESTATAGNIILGNNSSNNLTVTNSVGIGDNVFLNQQNTIILGDENDSRVAVGIGTNTPNSKLVVNNTDFLPLPFSVLQDGEMAFQVLGNRGVSIGDNGPAPSRGLDVFGLARMQGNLEVNNDVHIGEQLYINTTSMPTDYSVAIDGRVACTEIRVQAVEDWPDYVFSEAYELMDIDEFRSFIQKNKHLPGVPSANEVNENGFEVGKTQEILLEKIEELSLYILQLEERLSEIEKEK